MMNEQNVISLVRNSLLLTAIFIVLATSAQAQDRYPRSEVFVGGTYLAFGLNDDAIREHLGGIGLGVSGNFNRRAGVAFDYSLGFTTAGDQEHTYVVGPRFSARRDGYTYFGHVMVGGSTARSNGHIDTDPALAAGGGVDINAGRLVAIRFQGDYLPIFGGGNTLHNFRFMAGVVFRLGGK